jgi:hypothetical protein
VGDPSLDPAGWGFATSLTVVDNGALTVENCEIRNSGDVGIFNYYNNSNLIVKTTRVTGSVNYGVLNWEGANLTMECCEFSDNGDTLPELWIEDGLVDLVGARCEFADSAGTLIYAGDPSFLDLEDGENNLNLWTGNGRYLQSGDTSVTWDITMNAWSPVEPNDSNFYSYLYPHTPGKWTVDSSLADFMACESAGSMSIGTGNLLLSSGGDDPGTYTTGDNDQSGMAALSMTNGKSDIEVSKSAQERKSEVKGSPDARKNINHTELRRRHNQELAQWREVKQLAKSASKSMAATATKKFLNDHPVSDLIPAALVSLASLAGQDNSVSEFLMKKSAELPDHEARKLARRLAYKAKADEGKPAEALAGLEELMETAETPRDSVKALVDAMGVYFFRNKDHSLQPRNPEVINADAHTLVRRVIELAKVINDPKLVAATRSPAIPTQYYLYQNFPNPFNPNTEIKFDLPEAVKVQLSVFNILGQHVTTLVNEVRPAGAYRVIWDSKNAGGSSVASGVYVYQLKAGNFIDAKKMVLIR